ncbi:MAG: MBL fold metallo-hydrolase [Candidatus Izemoplasmatales bacterium]
MKLKIFNENQMDVNSYLLINKKKAILIDPGFNGKDIEFYCKTNGIAIDSVLLTHGHYDHIRDISFLKDYFDFLIYIHNDDYKFLFDGKLNFSQSFNRNYKLDKSYKIKKIKDNDKLELIDLVISVIHTPGHTPGSSMFHYNNFVFSGDTLFYDSIGRTDLFSGNFNAIRRSINKIKNHFSNNTIFYPGHGRHGDLNTIKKVNRFLQ